MKAHPCAIRIRYFLLLACANALAAAVFDSALVRPSRKTFDAAVAAIADVVFWLPVCASALAAAVLEFLPVSLLCSTLDATVATALLVFLDVVI